MSSSTTTFSPFSNRLSTSTAKPPKITMTSSSIFLFPPLAYKRPTGLTFRSTSPPLAHFSGIRSSRTRTIRRRVSSPRPSSHLTVSASVQSNIYKVLQTTWKVARNGIETGSSFVPESVPRPVARIGITVSGGIVALFVLKSFLSTLFFVLAMIGVIYFAFIALNTNEGPKGGESRGASSTDEETLEEARRIMDKYK